MTAGAAYSFQPVVSAPSGATLTFSITNTPAWATFDATTGALSGTPSAANVGSSAHIEIAVSDGSASASLAPFSITVNAPAAAASAPLTATNNADACLPFAMPATDALFASPNKVFAHYFLPFPLQINNVPAAQDYYNLEYLNREGESDKWAAQGGYLRQRPLGVPVSSNPNWLEANMQHEVSLAIARGITGFTFDVLSPSDATSPTGPLQLMLRPRKPSIRASRSWSCPISPPWDRTRLR